MFFIADTGETEALFRRRSHLTLCDLQVLGHLRGAHACGVRVRSRARMGGQHQRHEDFRRFTAKLGMGKGSRSVGQHGAWKAEKTTTLGELSRNIEKLFQKHSSRT